MLSIRNIRFKVIKAKLAPRFIRLFYILEKVGKQAYYLALPN